MKNISIGFTGDIAFSEYTKNLYETPEKIDEEIYEFLNSNDYNIINFESPITNFLKTKKMALAHRSDINSLNFIKTKIKEPILSLANNHMMDFGHKGLEDTLKYIRRAKFKRIGAGENEKEATNYIILGKEVKVGILAFQYKDYYIAGRHTCGTAHDTHKKLIKKRIKELKNKVDWIVVVYHGGDEFINVPLPYHRKKLKKILDWGADIVVAHHPHTVQGYEKFKDKMIFYSLGNFVFDTNYQRAQKGTEYGELISISFNKENYEFKNLNLYNDRENNKIKVIDSYEYFKDIQPGYKEAWKKQALELENIRALKKDLKKYRKNFSLEGLYIERAQCENYMPFEDLVEKHYFIGIDDHVYTKNRFWKRVRRKLGRLAHASYKKRLCILFAKSKTRKG